MVGFGSSLRMARRPGWEDAYLEYETLKLLLSQIEAVYEEEGHRVNDSRRVHTIGEEEGEFKKVDYREELFLESDSDAAYESVEDDSDNNGQIDHRDLNKSVPFTLSRSLEENSSDDEEEDLGCVSSSLTSWAASWDTYSRTNSNEGRTNTLQRQTEASFFSSGAASGATGAFFMSGEGVEASGSILNAPVFRTGERTALLHPQTPATNNRWYTMGTVSHPVSLTPPGAGHPVLDSSQDAEATAARRKQFVDERVQERKARRIEQKKKRKLRSKKEKKVPRHVRVAHTKARAITERFLGLVRAETEKVLLFAQAKLGELADTAGSLRFGSLEHENAPRESRGNASFGYTLSDGGMHPSGSSSSDEGPNGADLWSESSGSDEDTNGTRNRAGSLGMSTSLLSDETLNRTNRSSARGTTPRTKPGRASRGESEKRQEDAAKALDSARRHIAHFTTLRNVRPIFQRNDQILGEDMLLISAVEEADGFTAIGVELTHVLRYICVNLIAIRKICRKHDRLLMNRMLGGYYHRAKNQGHGSYTNIEDEHTLGGRLARISGDIYEAHPALFGHMNHYKLSGVYDRKIQKLANSRTVQVISSCLALALSEYEVNRSRADKLTQLKSTGSMEAHIIANDGRGVLKDLEQPVLNSDDDLSTGAPSTASTMSLTRLRFTVTSIFALREAARFKKDFLGAYLSRSLCTFTGQSTMGDGLDGCSRETLDFLVSFDPDTPLLLDTSVLYVGLKCGEWLDVPVGDVLLGCLSVASNPRGRPTGQTLSSYLTREEMVVATAVSIAPGTRRLLKMNESGFGCGFGLSRHKFLRTSHVSGLPGVVLWLNRAASFIYMMNYYVAHSGANDFTLAIDADSAFSSVIIGIPNAAAIVASLFQANAMSTESIGGLFPTGGVLTLRRMFIMSSLMGVLGNAMNATGVARGSLPLAIMGRFVLGFAYVELLQRQIIGTCFPAFLVSESIFLVCAKVSGTVFGLFLGALLEALRRSSGDPQYANSQYAGWTMATVWFIYMAVVILKFWDGRRETTSAARDRGGPDDSTVRNLAGAKSSSLDYDSDASSSMEYGAMSRTTDVSLYGAPDRMDQDLSQESSSSIETPQAGVLAESVSRRSPFRRVKNFTIRTAKLFSYRMAIPISLALLVYTTYSTELLFSATPIITHRYFRWTGDMAGSFLGLIMLLFLPINFLCEKIARRYEERTIIKRSLYIIGGSLFAMINWVSFVSVVRRMPSMLADRPSGTTSHPYDWEIGKYQYSIGLLACFVGLVALEGASLSLTSKVSPPRIRSISNHVGTMTVFLVLIARGMGSLHIFFVELSHKLINIDIVNSLVVPSILAVVVALYFVKKHFFFLM